MSDNKIQAIYNNRFTLVADTVEIQARILLRRAIYDKDREALGRLHFIYYSRIKCYIISRINSISDAEDLSQNVFLELCKGNSHYDGQRDAEAYLFGIARNLVSRYHRNNRKHIQTVQLESTRDFAISYDIQQQQDPFRQVSAQQLKTAIKDALAHLPPKAREAIRLRFIEGLSSKEAAKKTGCHIDMFYHRFYEGLKALRNRNWRSIS